MSITIPDAIAELEAECTQIFNKTTDGLLLFRVTTPLEKRGLCDVSDILKEIHEKMKEFGCTYVDDFERKMRCIDECMATQYSLMSNASYASRYQLVKSLFFEHYKTAQQLVKLYQLRDHYKKQFEQTMQQASV